MIRSWVRRRRARAEAVRVVGLLRSATGGSTPLVAVVGGQGSARAAALRALLPADRVVLVPPEAPQRHLLMTALGPFDGVVDLGSPQDRLQQFERAFFQLRPGGLYVVPGAAAELGPRPGPLGQQLADGRRKRGGSLRDDVYRALPRTTRRIAMRDHVTARAVAGDLVLSHDLPDVLVKIPEQQFNDYLARFPTPHQVLRVVPAVPPPSVPRLREGPRQKNVAATDRPLEGRARSLREYREAIMAPRQLVVAGRLILPDTYRHHASVLLRHKKLADLAPWFAVPTSPLPTDLPRLEGTFVHLDNEARGHFGHLMTETLSRAWTWPEALRIDPDARALVSATPKRPRLLDYELELYDAMGLPRHRIVLIDGPVRVERLISGTSMLSQPEYVDPRIVETWRTVGDRLAARATPREWPRRFFVTRRTVKRACVNAEEVEAIFAEHGFAIVHPEDHSMADQVAMFRAAEVIAGFAGSGLFQLALVPRPTHLIMIGSELYAPRNEYVIAAAGGHRIDSVVCGIVDAADHHRSMHATYRLDPAYEGRFLRELLAELPAGD